MYTFSSFQGNIAFSTTEDSDQAYVNDKDALISLATQLGVTHEDCSKALCYRVVAARGEVMEKGHNRESANYGRDALAKVGALGDGLLHLLSVSVTSLHSHGRTFSFFRSHTRQRARRVGADCYLLNGAFLLSNNFAASRDLPV